MRLRRIKGNSRAEAILRILKAQGPKTRGELAQALGIEPLEYKFDIEDLRLEYKAGIRKSPPRRNIKVYPYLPGTLAYMSKMEQKKNWGGTWEGFMVYYKPWIVYENGKWAITEHGLIALEILDEGN